MCVRGGKRKGVGRGRGEARGSGVRDWKTGDADRELLGVDEDPEQLRWVTLDAFVPVAADRGRSHGLLQGNI